MGAPHTSASTSGRGPAAEATNEEGNGPAPRAPAQRLGSVLPDFLVIGAQRAGTSLLHQILLTHPEVYVPRRRKEVHYFDWYFERGADWYRGFFPSAAEAARFRAIGEATPDYLATPEAPERIHALLPGCRLIVILRNPVDRAYSWYLYARRIRDERRSFEDFLKHDPTTLEWGLYARHLERYLALFPRAALLVLIYEELVREPAEELGRLARFLDLSTGWAAPERLLQRPINTSQRPYFRTGFALAHELGELLMRHDVDWPVRIAKRLGAPRLFGTGAPNPGLPTAARAELSAFYDQDVRRLEALLGRKVSAWRAEDS